MYNPVKCLHPLIVRNKFTNELISVPCGKCEACVTKRSLLWTSRLREESTCHIYTLFLTLTYDDSHLPVIDLSTLSLNDELDTAIKASSSYISFCNSKIPCLSVKDLQNFFKRLRSYISYHHGTQTSIRYFVVAEYGPTTFRPHYHLLLWFDSPDLVSTIKMYIYKAWKSKTNHQTISSFFRRNKCVFVHGNAENYVAGYLNRFTHLPPILACKPFRPFHCQSSNPPIGTIRILKESLSALLSGDVSQVTLHRLSSGDAVALPLWRGLENRFFPKCIGFSTISSGYRRTLYTIYREFCKKVFDPFSEFKSQSTDFKSFLTWILPKWFSDEVPFYQIRKLCGDSSSLDSPDEKCIQSLHRLFNISRRISQLSQSLCITEEDYVSRIETYYSRKEYFALCQQLTFQEYLSNSSRSDENLSYYPFLIDNLFYENFRNLDSSTYQDYLRQFGLDGINDFMFTYESSTFYKLKKSLSEKIFLDSHKTRIKKDYVSNHPECYFNVSNLLTSKL